MTTDKVTSEASSPAATEADQASPVTPVVSKSPTSSRTTRARGTARSSRSKKNTVSEDTAPTGAAQTSAEQIPAAQASVTQTAPAEAPAADAKPARKTSRTAGTRSRRKTDTATVADSQSTSVAASPATPASSESSTDSNTGSSTESKTEAGSAQRDAAAASSSARRTTRPRRSSKKTAADTESTAPLTATATTADADASAPEQASQTADDAKSAKATRTSRTRRTSKAAKNTPAVAGTDAAATEAAATETATLATAGPRDADAEDAAAHSVTATDTDAEGLRAGADTPPARKTARSTRSSTSKRPATGRSRTAARQKAAAQSAPAAVSTASTEEITAEITAQATEQNGDEAAARSLSQTDDAALSVASAADAATEQASSARAAQSAAPAAEQSTDAATAPDASNSDAPVPDASDPDAAADESTAEAAQGESTEEGAETQRRKSRRGRRGGRGRNRKNKAAGEGQPAELQEGDADSAAAAEDAAQATDEAQPESGAAASGSSRGNRAAKAARADKDAAEDADKEPAAKPAKAGKKRMFISVLPGEQVEVALAEEGCMLEYYLDMLHQRKFKGNIYKGIIHNIDTNLQAAFVSYGTGKNGFLQIDEVHPEYWLSHFEPCKGKKFPPIQKVLKAGQEVLVQVVKEPTGNKGAFLTTWLSLAGRFLVLTPGQEQIGVSRKVDREEERSRLRAMMNGIDPGQGLGVIVRTVSAGTTKTTLKNDLQYLKRLWRDIRKKATEVAAPALIYQEPSLSERAVRDYLTDDVCEIWVDHEEEAQNVRETVGLLSPRKKDLVRMHTDVRQSMWDRFNLRRQMEQIYAREVLLPSGGRLVFDQTEALMAIDINSGKISGKGNFEAMAFKTNMEAAETIARQLKLRDVGGQVVIDFIEMRDKKHVLEVEKTLRLAMKNDRARHDVSRMSSFGLLELVRQRMGSSALAISMEPCPCCNGTGQRRNMEWQALQCLRELRRLLRACNGEKYVYETSSELGLYLLNHKRDSLREMEQDFGKCLEIAIKA